MILGFAFKYFTAPPLNGEPRRWKMEIGAFSGAASTETRIYFASLSGLKLMELNNQHDIERERNGGDFCLFTSQKIRKMTHRGGGKAASSSHLDPLSLPSLCASTCSGLVWLVKQKAQSRGPYSPSQSIKSFFFSLFSVHKKKQNYANNRVSRAFSLFSFVFFDSLAL
jgi:hypothetical protein